MCIGSIFSTSIIFKFEDSNLTNKDYLNFLVNSYSNQKNAKDSKIRLIVPGKGKKITYGEQDAVLDFNSEQDIARFKEWAKQNLKRHVSKELLKTNRLGKDFTFLGIDYSKSDSYIDFLTGKDQTNTDNHVLLTDVKLDETGSPVTFYPPGYDIQFQTDVNSETVEGEQTAAETSITEEPTTETTTKTVTPENGKPAQGTNNTDSGTASLADEAFDDNKLGEEGENTAENFDLTMTVGQMPTVEDKNTERIDRKKAERNFRKIVGKLIPLEFQKSLIRIAGSNIRNTAGS